MKSSLHFVWFGCDFKYKIQRLCFGGSVDAGSNDNDTNIYYFDFSQ